ncbi:flagellar biosynthesis protein FlhB [Neobacillus notoginsengisoli]|uniref:Flagellar biosynthetic protein FlhB n=1 Tax=Neobacillus notoginsengisoli TaxID=1578198 RepID=A0A417YJP7_9BACI|nr:flagellar biosynthesis protein FlhB [Neobacillus notoginsengisoli]RHW33299.1 flagellar biosynthesis protein FlhB [Neobacillus notoginsengisoli]
MTMLVRLDLQLFAEKTEKATPRKKQDARKKGQVAKSTDLSNAVVLLGSFSFLAIYGEYAGGRLLQMFKVSLSNSLLYHLTEESVVLLFKNILFNAVLIAAPIIVIAWLAAIVSTISQVGFLVAPESIKMDLKKIDPISGAKRIFSMRSIVELLKSILKVLLITTVAGIFLWKQKGILLKLPQMEPLSIVGLLASLTVKMGMVISAAYLVLAVGDLFYQRYDHAKKLKMSKQDIKDEHKKTEGDPLVKQKIKEKQRQVASFRMMQDIPKAQVIITNPTHFAVAIAYEAGKMSVPTVVAKGADFLALKIREVAKEHRVVIMENKPLARALYAGVEVGEEIPEELFKAVAEVLAYVYRVKGTLSK